MIIANNISKQLEGKTILSQISFHIKEHEAVGVIGKNGAGKTTLLRILSGTLKEDGGYVRLRRQENFAEDKESLRKFSFISGGKSLLWQDMILQASFDNCAAMYHIPKNQYQERLSYLVESLEMEKCLQKPVQSLSLGQRARGQFIYALLPQPELLFLDEAAIGLDVSAKEKVFMLLQELREKRKTTIIYTSHNLTEIERICDRVLLLEGGKLIYDGSIKHLIQRYGKDYKIYFQVINQLPDMEDLPISSYNIENQTITITYDKQKITTAELVSHILNQCTIKNMELEEPNLEDTIGKLLS
ncbi:MAG: ATP-binding cassette domain-containing protein [Lachnospiraceae bacterium]|nr:ATP-binding cassette domain-containing protein [Lachnospiraceae bacterium]